MQLDVSAIAIKFDELASKEVSYEETYLANPVLVSQV